MLQKTFSYQLDFGLSKDLSSSQYIKRKVPQKDLNSSFKIFLHSISRTQGAKNYTPTAIFSLYS